MFLTVNNSNRRSFTRVMDSMFRDRKTVFVDRLKWNVPVVDGIYEIDQFDNDDAIYVIAVEPATGQHIGSVRLLPTVKPHLLSEVFPQLCERGVPRGDDIWEVTRMLVAPHLGREQSLTVRTQLSIAMLEVSLLYGITQITCVTHLAFIPQMLSFGWDCRPLGLPQDVGGELVGALSIAVTAEALHDLRLRTGRRLPLLELTATDLAA